MKEAQRKKAEAQQILEELRDAMLSDMPPTQEFMKAEVERARDLLVGVIVELEVEP